MEGMALSYWRLKVSIEDDLFSALKYMNVVSPTKAVEVMLKSMCLTTLKQLRTQINKHIKELSTSGDASLDPFAILGVGPNASRAEVDKAYREKARRAHPDVGGSNEEMIKINAAYEAIRRFKGWS